MTYYSTYTKDNDPYLRLDARAGMTLCTPGKTVPCGKVCRTPANCKKGKAGKERVKTIGKEALKEYAEVQKIQKRASNLEKRSKMLNQKSAWEQEGFTSLDQAQKVNERYGEFASMGVATDRQIEKLKSARRALGLDEVTGQVKPQAQQVMSPELKRTYKVIEGHERSIQETRSLISKERNSLKKSKLENVLREQLAGLDVMNMILGEKVPDSQKEERVKAIRLIQLDLKP